MFKNLEEKTLARLAENFVKIRKKKGYTQEKMAELLGYSREYIAKVETCNRNVSINLLIRTVNALNINITEIWNID